MAMTIEQLACFFEVAHCSSFSRAAERLYLSQSNLTKYISKLEQELGVRLFDRSTHHCQLTEEGHLFFRQTEDLFFQLNSRIEDAKLRGHNMYRTVQIGSAPGEPPIPQFMDLLRQFNQAEKQYRYLLQESTYLELIHKLQSHELDLIVTSDRNARAVESFAFCRLSTFQMLLAIHKSDPKAKKADLKPADCADEITFLAMPDGKSAPISRMAEFDRNTGGGLNLTILPSPADLLNNVLIRAGVGIIPNTVDQSRYPEIAFFTFEDPKPASGQHLIWRRDEKKPAVLRLIQQVQEKFAIPEDI
jgi:DNA-binding transcriptional LysR family regulator